MAKMTFSAGADLRLDRHTVSVKFIPQNFGARR